MPQSFWANTSDINAGNGFSQSGWEWNHPTVGGNVLPGAWSVRVRARRDIEKKKQKGKDGAAITDQGDNPTEIELRGEIFTQEDWDSWQGMSDAFFAKKKGKERAPLAIVHPQTASKGITSVYLEEVEETIGADEDVLVVTMKLIEWTPRPKEVVVKKAVQQAPTDTYGPLPTIQEEVARDVANLNAKMLQALGGK